MRIVRRAKKRKIRTPAKIRRISFFFLLLWWLHFLSDMSVMVVVIVVMAEGGEKKKLFESGLCRRNEKGGEMGND